MSDQPAPNLEEARRDAMMLLAHTGYEGWQPPIHNVARAYLALLNEWEAREERLQRAVYLARRLFGMIPREVWRANGGDDEQGHYEGDYYAENVATELEELRKVL